MISEWAVMRDREAVVVNYYGPMTAQGRMGHGAVVRIVQDTKYPLEGDVRLRITLMQAEGRPEGEAGRRKGTVHFRCAKSGQSPRENSGQSPRRGSC